MFCISTCNVVVWAGMCERRSLTDGWVLTDGNVGACPILHLRTKRYSYYVQSFAVINILSIPQVQASKCPPPARITLDYVLKSGMLGRKTCLSSA